jgi:vibriolysin
VEQILAVWLKMWHISGLRHFEDSLMYKKSVIAILLLSPTLVFSLESVQLHNQSTDSLKNFSFNNSGVAKRLAARAAPNPNQLTQIMQFQQQDKQIKRYQQYYKGIPVIGKQVIMTSQANTLAANKGRVNGAIINDLQLSVTPKLTANKAIDIAKSKYFEQTSLVSIKTPKAALQIRIINDKAVLTYLVDFKVFAAKPAWPHVLIDAQSGDVLKQWNNLKNFADRGPGGNEKTHQYWYGQDGLPSLEVKKKDNQCTLDNAKVKLVHLDGQWDWDDQLLTPFTYTCGNNQGDPINGAFSPANDAYILGNVIVNMYQKWYGINALQTPDGKAMPLVMRVHFGRQYDNAFWDGATMSFGDGEDDYYPLVSLGVAGHEVSHGFTEQHSDLEYHDESGAVDEAFSDMAGIASRAYLLETNPILYHAMYPGQENVSWDMGVTIMKEPNTALRYMDQPSRDGASADCLDKKIALKSGASCKLSYSEIVETIKAATSDEEEQQSYIVHTASGIFNKAFYLMAKEHGVKKTFQIMLAANTNYWTPNSNFTQAACGVIYAAGDLNQPNSTAISAFNQVGIDTSSCQTNDNS